MLIRPAKTFSGDITVQCNRVEAQFELWAEAVRLTKGQKTAAARILGIDRRRLNRLIEKLDISVSSKR